MSDRYVYLVRHGARNRVPDVKEAEHRLADATPVQTTGAALADYLQATYCSDERTIESILTSGHVVAAETAAVLSNLLAARGVLAPAAKVRLCDDLTPGPVDDRKHDEHVINVCIALETKFAGDVLVVGHQPQLTFIADRLLGGRLPAGTLPIGRAELACIRITSSRHLMWLLTSKSDALRVSLRDKIKSKFDVASLFLSALVVNLGVMLGPAAGYVFENGGLAAKVLAGAGLLALMLALGLSVATLLALDRLLMPEEFWGGVPRDAPPLAPERDWSVPRPPSDVTVVIFYEMVHVWGRMFAPALVLTFAGIGGVAAAGASAALALPNRAALMMALALTVVGCLLRHFYVTRRPELGFND
jgi:phosphohistidine phosphatase SixA